MGHRCWTVTAARLGVVALGCLAGAACSTEPSGSLSIALDQVPKVTNAASVTISGSVTRTPAKETQTVVRATGGAGTPVDTVKGGRFNLKVTLNPNTTNQLSIVASDATGSSSPAVAVTIRTDNQPPTIAQATPADTSDNVTPPATIQLKMSEPVIIASNGGVRLTRQGATIPGGTTLSADSLTLTFTPSALLSPNAIYRVGLSGVSDAATNPSDTNASACFVTATTGATASTSLTDQPHIYRSGTATTNLERPGIVAARFAREGTLFSGVYRYIGPRVYSTVATNQALLDLDLDTDQDSTTGFSTQKDQLFNNPVQMHQFDSLSSGTKAEYLVALEPGGGTLGDSAYVGKYTSDTTANLTATFIPTTCGALFGFVVPFSTIGSVSGNMNVVTLAFAFTSGLVYVDPMPYKSHFTVTLAAPAGPAPSMAEMPWSVPPSQVNRRVRARIPRLLAR